MKVINKMLRKIIIRLAPLFWVVDLMVLRFGNRKRKEQTKSDTIVFVRLDAIGDFFMWLDAAKQYRRIFRGKRIILICNSVYQDIAEASGYFDEVFAVDCKKLLFPSSYRYRLSLRKKLSVLQAETAVQTSYSRRIYADYIIAAIPAQRKYTMRDVEFDHTPKRIGKFTEKIYTDVITSASEMLMEIQKNAELARQVTGVDFESAIPEFPKQMLRSNLEFTEPYFVVFPGGSFAYKMWQTERFAKAAEAIHRETGWIPAVCGSPSEKPLAESFKKNYHGGKVIDLTGETTLLESIEVIRKAQYLIGNDTSGIHIAAAVGTPSFCIFGGWHFGRFLPYDVDHPDERRMPEIYYHQMDCFHCKIKDRTKACQDNVKKAGHFTCIDSITADEAASAMLRHIGRLGLK